MTDTQDRRHITRAIKKYKALHVLNRWIYLLEQHTLSDRDAMVTKYGIDLNQVRSAKKSVARFAEDLEAWTIAEDNIEKVQFNDNLTDEDLK